jgi:putative tryptophan/tyrosine transport system substrate-binding protein
MFQAKEYPADGGLLAYAPDYGDQGNRAARHVDRILKGAKPGDLPVERPTRFALVISNRASNEVRAGHQSEGCQDTSACDAPV